MPTSTRTTRFAATTTSLAGSFVTPVETNPHGHLGPPIGEVGDRHRLRRTFLTVADGEPPAPCTPGRPERERDALPSVGPVEARRSLGDDPPDSGVHRDRDGALSPHEVVQRHRDPGSPRHDERLDRVGTLQAAVGQQRDVDDRVGAERVEQHEPVLGAPVGRSLGEVPAPGRSAASTGRPRRRRGSRSRARRPRWPPNTSTTTPGSAVLTRSATRMRRCS